MDGLASLEVILLIGSATALAGIAVALFGRRLSLPVPAILLLAASAVAIALPTPPIGTRGVVRVATVGLVLILFAGGLEIGLRRLRAALWPTIGLGLWATAATAALGAVAAHVLVGMAWLPAAALGTALAPTDPAVVFSVLGPREIAGRLATILEGESGANDPVGIAAMLGVLALAGHGHVGVAAVVGAFLAQLLVGAAAGLAGGLALRALVRHLPLPTPGLYPVLSLAGAFCLFGATGLAHGSGFLAVFVAGMVVADAGSPYQAEVERFHGALASLAELAVFIALGLTLPLSDLGGAWIPGLAMALLVAVVARPVAAGPVLAAVRLRPEEKLFATWAGLKGAVPILLAGFAVNAGLSSGRRIYEIVFVAVTTSVLLQGSSVGLAARLLHIELAPRLHRPLRRADDA